MSTRMNRMPSGVLVGKVSDPVPEKRHVVESDMSSRTRRASTGLASHPAFAECAMSIGSNARCALDTDGLEPIRTSATQSAHGRLAMMRYPLFLTGTVPFGAARRYCAGQGSTC